MSNTKDIDDAFFPELDEVAAFLSTDDSHVNPVDMLCVMYSESGARATARNPAGNASGLIQFMPATLEGLGWKKGHEAFRKLSATEQLAYVKKYYAPYKGHLHTIAGLYTATFLPALVKHADNPDYVLTAKGGQLGWAYAPNAALDSNGDYRIQVSEMSAAVRKNCAGARWLELRSRQDGHPVTAPSVHYDLGSIVGMQTALFKLGHLPEDGVDGFVGDETRGALRAFQQASGLTVDGIYGPRSRNALALALA